MQIKRPMVKETVGALYLAHNIPTKDGEFDAKSSSYEETNKSEVVKNIKTTENAETTKIRASGKDYLTANQSASVEMDVEVVAFDPTDLARMRKDIVGTAGLNRSGRTGVRPYFAFGKVVKKVGGAVEYAWYPKCQLTENTDDIETSEESLSEQNDTIKITAYAYNDEGDIRTYVNSEMSNFPEGLTEEKFFTKPILTDEDLAAANTAGA